MFSITTLEILTGVGPNIRINGYYMRSIPIQGKNEYYKIETNATIKTVNLQHIIALQIQEIKAGLYRICCGVNRLGDSGVHTLADNSAFVNPASQLLLTGGVRPDWMASA